MKPVTAAIAYNPDPRFETLLSSLAASGLVERVVVANGVDRADPWRAEPNCDVLIGSLYSSDTLKRLLDSTRTEYLLLIPNAGDLSFEPGGIERLVRLGETSRAGVVYSDFYASRSTGKTLRPLNDYQEGSVRDTFDFGALMLYSVSAVRQAWEREGPLPPVSVCRSLRPQAEGLSHPPNPPCSGAALLPGRRRQAFGRTGDVRLLRPRGTPRLKRRWSRFSPLT